MIYLVQHCLSHVNMITADDTAHSNKESSCREGENVGRHAGGNGKSQQIVEDNTQHTKISMFGMNSLRK